jgi:hypothetical protein
MIAMREPDEVMRLDRLGSLHASRLSFLRILLRRIQEERWSFQRTVFDIGADCTGDAVYTAHSPHRSYSLIVFAHQLNPEHRTDRVIANAWDATFTLFDGIPSAEDIDRLRSNVPLQEAGRLSASELTMSRANKSVRLWDAVVAALAAGTQPPVEEIDDTGYLMRTTAVYGSGKFGACDREMILDRPELQPAFQAEMLTVLMIRQFARDWLEHEAYLKAPDSAVRLDESLATRLGIGNSTGLGMAPFLINHPVLIDHWVRARETAIARVKAIIKVAPCDRELVMHLLRRARADFALWQSADEAQSATIEELIRDVDTLIGWIEVHPLHATSWADAMRFAKTELCLEAQEILASVMLEPYSNLVDELASGMAVAECELMPVNGSLTVGESIAQIDDSYDWLDDIQWKDAHATALLWYVSEEKLEPRLGFRAEDAFEAYEQPLAPARDITAYRQALSEWPSDATLAEFLMRQPEHRLASMRVQWIASNRYGEIRGNTIDAGLRPIDLLRCKLSFFGATRFDPRSDRWLRITLYRHAPYLDQIVEADPFWIYGPVH